MLVLKLHNVLSGIYIYIYIYIRPVALFHTTLIIVCDRANKPMTHSLFVPNHAVSCSITEGLINFSPNLLTLLSLPKDQPQLT